MIRERDRNREILEENRLDDVVRSWVAMDGQVTEGIAPVQNIRVSTKANINGLCCNSVGLVHCKR